MADTIKPDLCVIGAGALGTSLAIRARQAGLAVALLRCPRDESNDPTADTLRRAAFVASAARAQALRSAGTLGIPAAEPKPNFRTISERAAAMAESIAPRDTDERLAALGITVLSGTAGFTDRNTLRCGDLTIRARQFALAMGAQPLVPALPGLDQVAFFTPHTIADNIRKLSHLVVIGGTPLALQLAQAYCRLGAMVTLVPQVGLLPGFDTELVAILLRSLREEGVVIRDDALVTAINPRSQGIGISLESAEGPDSLDVSHILVAMGEVPDLDPDLLDQARLKRDQIHPERLLLGPDGQTSSGRITALGGAAGTDDPQLGRRQAVLLVERLLGRGAGRIDPLSVPRLVLTEPALAQLGPHDAVLRPGQAVLRANLAENDLARAQGLAHGAARVIVDARGRIGAAGAVGPGAGELMAQLALSQSQGLRLDALTGLCPPQPSTAAVLVDLADQYLASQPSARWWQRLPMIGKMPR